MALPACTGAQGEPQVVFLLQPGIASADFISAPVVRQSTSGFSLRFATLLETRYRAIRPVFGASVTPFGSSGYTTRNTNTPVLFVGNVFPSFGSGVLQDWARLEVALLWYYSYGGGREGNVDLYGRDIFGQLGAHIPIGRRVLSDLGPFWRNLELYALLDQNLTPNRDLDTGKRDRFNPVAAYGVTLRFPSRRAP